MKSPTAVQRTLRPLLRPSSLRSITTTTRISHTRPSRAVLNPHSCSQRSPIIARPFSVSLTSRKGLQPDTHEPKAPEPEDHTTHTVEPAEITAAEYNEIADQYIDTLVLSLEELAEDAKNGVEVEYSAGVLTLNHAAGTYIINKQPPNKQIWLSSPVSGPKRYDWVISGDGQHQKEGTETHSDGAGGKWTYLRDGSTLSELLEKEVGVNMGGKVDEGDFTAGKEGPGGSGVSE